MTTSSSKESCIHARYRLLRKTYKTFPAKYQGILAIFRIPQIEIYLKSLVEAVTFLVRAV